MMYQLNIKPLTVNQAWCGRRFKTSKYKEYEKELWYTLPRIKVPEGKLKVHYQFGFSYKGSDYDNAIKQFQDIISRKYKFNDSRIYKAIVEKIDVDKEKEFIRFKIEKL